VVLPSLWQSVAGDRPVPNDHDDPGQITWDWKDSLLGSRRWYYARVLRHRNTIISLDLLPSFYALSPNFGDYKQDYLIQYEEGKFPLEAKLIYDALLKEGPLDTLQLRRAARMTGTGTDTRFNRALDILQGEFKLLPVGISQAGAWHYAFIYDIPARHFAGLENDARFVSESQACQNLIHSYVRSLGAVQRSDINRIFGWQTIQVDQAVISLEKRGLISLSTSDDHSSDDWVIFPDLIPTPR
jgi:hypothetical protein